MIIHDVPQGSPEWLKLRKGIITGTKLKAIASKPSTLTYKTLIDELIAEDLGPVAEIFKNDAMLRGTMLEPIAREKYEEVTGYKVDELGFCIHNTMSYLGLSPDGFIKNKDGKYTRGLEIKCPGTKNHLKYILANTIPKEYQYQILNYFIVNEDLEILDFMTFNPDIYMEHLRYKIITVTRGQLQEGIDEMIIKIKEFKVEWQKQLEYLMDKTLYLNQEKGLLNEKS